jgi:hypothetical protein
MLAPSIVVLICLAYFIAFGVGIILAPGHFLFKAGLLGVPAGLILAMLYVLYKRYTEIKGGFEDDLDDY